MLEAPLSLATMSSPRATLSPEDMVHVRVAEGEDGLRTKLKVLGALWRPRPRPWELSWGALRAIEIEGRIVRR